MGTNEDLRNAQQQNISLRSESPLVTQLAMSAGVDEEDTAKILTALGFFMLYPGAVQLNDGEDPQLSSLRLAFRIGEVTLLA
jgi:hypothetical protein